MCRRERDFDCQRRRYLFVEYRQHFGCCQRDSVGDHDLYGYGDLDGRLHCHGSHYCYRQSVANSLHYCIGDLWCNQS